jgi:hypothetical protein
MTDKKFPGFEQPAQNYSKLPHTLIDCLPVFSSMAELKVVVYLLRHTWGFSEYGEPKKITTDEFMNGRKRRDGTRLDKGTGLVKNSVISGLELAVEHGFILVEVDKTDLARIEKRYCLNMSDVQMLNIGVQDLDIGGSNVEHRSEKETKVKNFKKVKGAPKEPAAPPPAEVTLFRSVTERYPSKEVWAVVVEAVQKVSARLNRPAELSDLLSFWQAWRSKGYRKDNLSWLTDWAASGAIPAYVGWKGNGNANVVPSAAIPSEPDVEFGREIRAARV